MPVSDQVKIELKIEVAKSAQSIKEVRKSINDLKNAALSVEENSEAFHRLTKAAGAAKERLDDVNKAVRANAGNNIEKLSQHFFLLKENVKNLDFEKASGNLKELISSGIAGFADLGKSLLANPLFLIVGVIALIISKFDDLKSAGGLVGKVFSGIGDIISGTINLFKSLTDAIGLTGFAAEEAGKKQIASFKDVNENLTKQIDREIKLREAQGKSIEELELKKQQILKDSADKQIEFLRDKQIFGEGLNEDEKKLLDEQLKQKEEAEFESQIISAKGNKERADKQEEAYKKSLEALKKNSEEELKIIDDRIKEAQKKYDTDTENYLTTQKQQFEDAVKAGEDRIKLIITNDKLQASLSKQKKDDEEARYQEELNNLKSQYDTKLTLVSGHLQQTLELTTQSQRQRELLEQQHNNNLAAIDKEAKDDERKKSQELADAKIAIATAVVSSLSSLGDILINDANKNAKYQKALAVTQLAIDTAKAISGAVAQAQSVPFPANIVAIATGVAAVLANIAKAKALLSSANVSTPSIGGGGAGGYGGSQQVKRAEFVSPELQGFNNQTSSGKKEDAPVFKTYVVSTDITNAQDKDKLLERRSTI